MSALMNDESNGLVEVSCDYCKKSEYEIIYPASLDRPVSESNFGVFGELGEYPQIVKCSSCGLVYANPRDTTPNLQEKYRTLSVEDYLLEENSRRVTCMRDVKFISGFVNGGKILDIGCSSGIFLSCLPENFDRYGVEPGVEGGMAAKRLMSDERIHIGTIDTAEYAESSFDIITMWDVIEHLDAPTTYLNRINKLLKPDGHIVVLTPDFGSISARLMGRKWPNLIRQHIYYFTRRTLAQSLSACGFSVVRTSTYSRYFTLAYLYRRTGLPFGVGVERIMRKVGIGGLGVWINVGDSLLTVAKKMSN